MDEDAKKAGGPARQIGAKFPKRDVFDASLGKVIAIARGTRTESLDGEHTTTTHLRWEVTFLRLKPRHR